MSFGLGDWARIISSNLPGNPGWDHLGPDGGPINARLQTHMSDATNDDRKHWTGFAIAAARGGYWTGDESDPNSTAYMATHPDDPRWQKYDKTRSDHDRFLTEAHGYNWEYHSSGGFNPIKALESIPVVGNIVSIVGEAAAAPFNFAESIASGERLDHALIGQLKDQIKIVKDVAPYAQTIVSLVPGIGTGVAAAIGAGAALAEGQSIGDAAKAAIRGALPGGAAAAAAFDVATKIASGENVGKAALESARNLVPAGPAQQAFDIGTAVATGAKIQDAFAQGLSNLASGQMQTILSVGQQALANTPGLSDAIKSVAPGGPQQGFTLAAGLLSHAGINEKALTTVRNQLTDDVRQGFDTALKAQTGNTAWLANVTNAPVVRPALHGPPPPPPTRPVLHGPTTPGAYSPYPKGAGAVSGLLGEATWGPAITGMSRDMEWAGKSAVHGSRGRPRVVRGPDGIDYLFAIDRGVLTARPRIGG